MIAPTGLLDRWTADEARFRAYGQDATADVIARCRAELSEWWRERQLDELGLEAAAAYSGLAYGTLSNKLRSGEIPNAGDKHRPRVRRCDLPTRAPGLPGAPDLDLADAILARRQLYR
ncbi:hypothetical protein BH18GEM1_BH18GEM1_08250 [soil metagenome]